MQDYNTIIGAIQMHLNGCPTRSVMDRYKIGSGTLSLIMERYHTGGIPIKELQMMPPKEVELLFYPQKNIKKKDIPLPDYNHAYRLIFKYLEAFYNTKRIHSHCDYINIIKII